MKIISLASYNSGEACSVFTCIKKYLYNNNCITDFFSYLEVSLEAVNQILLMDVNFIDLFFKDNYKIYQNKDGNYSIIFHHFDKMISHHDLKENNNLSFNIVIDKYKRRYYRLMDDIKNENKIFFIRYGKENPLSIKYFLELIKKNNPLLKCYFINIYCDEAYDIDTTIENCYYINFLDYIDKETYHEDLFYRVMEYDWSQVYKLIYNLLDNNEKEFYIKNNSYFI